MNTLSADVIVVGGGSAGCSAALGMREFGIQPLLVSKGLVGKSGCSIFAGALIVGGNMLDSTPAHAAASIEFFVKYYSQYLVDQVHLKSAGAWIEEVFYPELDEAGLYFRRDDEGRIVRGASIPIGTTRRTSRTSRFPGLRSCACWTSSTISSRTRKRISATAGTAERRSAEPAPFA